MDKFDKLLETLSTRWTELTGDISIVIAIGLIIVNFAREFRNVEVSRPAKTMELLPPLSVRDFLTRVQYWQLLSIFLLVAVGMFLLLCFLPKDVAAAAGPAFGFKPPSPETPWPLYLAALIVGISQSRINIPRVLSRFFHRRVGVPRQVSDFADEIWQQVDRRSGGNKEKLIAEIRCLTDNEWLRDRSSIFDKNYVVQARASCKDDTVGELTGDPLNALTRSALSARFKRELGLLIVGGLRSSGTLAIREIVDRLNESAKPKDHIVLGSLAGSSSLSRLFIYIFAFVAASFLVAWLLYKSRYLVMLVKGISLGATEGTICASLVWPCTLFLSGVDVVKISAALLVSLLILFLLWFELARLTYWSEPLVSDGTYPKGAVATFAHRYYRFGWLLLACLVVSALVLLIGDLFVTSATGQVRNIGTCVPQPDCIPPSAAARLTMYFSQAVVLMPVIALALVQLHARYYGRSLGLVHLLIWQTPVIIVLAIISASVISDLRLGGSYYAELFIFYVVINSVLGATALTLAYLFVPYVEMPCKRKETESLVLGTEVPVTAT